MPDEIWLPKEAQEHIAENLKPGERYQVELKSMTDLQKCLDEKAPKETFITKPLPPCKVQITATSDEATVTWTNPEGEGHSSLTGYKAILKTKADEKIVKEEVKPSKIGSRSLSFDNLKSTTEYVVAIATIYMDGLTTLGRRHSPNPPKLLEAQSDFVEKTCSNRF